MTAACGAEEIGSTFSTVFTVKRSSQTSGAMIHANTRMIGATWMASASECVSATRLGTSSPRISETKVTITTTIPKEILAAALLGTP